MAAIETCRVTDDDIAELSRTMRPDDAREVLASHGLSPRRALELSVDSSTEAWATRIDGDLVAIWGVTEVPTDAMISPRVGSCWMLTSAAVERHKVGFWRACRATLPLLLERWDLLFNAIDARHTRAVRWGKRLGFQFDQPAPWGVAGLDFLAYYLTRETLWAHQHYSV